MLTDHDFLRQSFFQRPTPKAAEALGDTLRFHREEFDMNVENEGDIGNKPSGALLICRSTEKDTAIILKDHMRPQKRGALLERSIQRAKRMIKQDLSSPRFSSSPFQTVPERSSFPAGGHSRNYSTFTPTSPLINRRNENRDARRSLLIPLRNQPSHPLTSIRSSQDGGRNPELSISLLNDFVSQVKRELSASSCGRKVASKQKCAQTLTTADNTHTSLNPRSRSQIRYSTQCQTCSITQQQNTTKEDDQRRQNVQRSWEQSLRRGGGQNRPPRIPRAEARSLHGRYQSAQVPGGKSQERIDEFEKKQDIRVETNLEARKKVLRKFLNPPLTQHTRVATVVFDCSEHRLPCLI